MKKKEIGLNSEARKFFSEVSKKGQEDLRKKIGEKKYIEQRKKISSLGVKARRKNLKNKKLSTDDSK